MTLGEKSESVSFSRVYVSVKAKLTLVSFFLLFFLCTFPLRTRHDTCMMYVWCRNVWCLLAGLHDAWTHDACTHDACTHDACTMHIAMIYLDPDACGYDAHVRNADECMYTCMMRKSMMLILFVTDQRTNQQWMMHACIYTYRSVSFVCMMHVSIIFDLWP